MTSLLLASSTAGSEKPADLLDRFVSDIYQDLCDAGYQLESSGKTSSDFNEFEYLVDAFYEFGHGVSMAVLKNACVYTLYKRALAANKYSGLPINTAVSKYLADNNDYFDEIEDLSYEVMHTPIMEDALHIDSCGCTMCESNTILMLDRVQDHMNQLQNEGMR